MAYEEIVEIIQVPRKGDWVMTKSKKIGCVGWEENYTHVYLFFFDGDTYSCRSYKRTGLVVLDRSMKKLLDHTYKELVDECIPKG